jgi:hypothetical protein
MTTSMANAAGVLGSASGSLVPSAYRIHALVEHVDQVALAMERKWGIDRLRLLVPAELRAKFDAQKDRLDVAIASNNEDLIRIHAEGMQRAWEALDRAASEVGHGPLVPEVWECKLLETGEIVSLVRTEAEAHLVVQARRVFTVAQIATLIARYCK